MVKKVICIVGSDGSGKTTLAKRLVAELQTRGLKTELARMRFNNYLSKPLLALARLRGYSCYKCVNGIKMGYHDFENVWWLRWPFAFLQMIDVNIATWLRFRGLKNLDVVVFERSAWDTLSDVMADTGIEKLEETWIGRGIVRAFNGSSHVMWISRNVESIRSSRKELAADDKLEAKIANYSRMCRRFEWTTIDNNGSLEAATNDLIAQVVKVGL